jgi:DNA-binding MurR/RpiR family transcriptional regulator
LFVVGAPEFEPWHFTAHLGEQATRRGRVDLVPTLLRWEVPVGAPSHLAVPVDVMSFLSRNETLLVIDPFGEAPELLERIASAKRRGARIMTLHRGQPDLMAMSHETLSVDLSRPERDFEITQHVVTDLAPTAKTCGSSKWWSRRAG